MWQPTESFGYAAAFIDWPGDQRFTGGAEGKLGADVTVFAGSHRAAVRIKVLASNRDVTYMALA